MSESEVVELKIRKQVAINEQGTAEVTGRFEYKNKGRKTAIIKPLSLDESTSDVVDIQVSDSKGRLLPFVKKLKDDLISIRVDTEETINSDETYSVIIQYTVPFMVKRFDNTYFYKELEIHAEEASEQIKTSEWHVIYQLPRLFSKYKFWKEMYVNAPIASRVHTDNGHKVIECDFSLMRSSSQECSFMFQERYNSKVVALLSFLVGVGLIQFFEWVVSLLF